MSHELKYPQRRLFGKGLNRYSNVHIDDLVELCLLALEKAPGGSFFFAENGHASFKEIAGMVSPALTRRKNSQPECRGYRTAIR